MVGGSLRFTVQEVPKVPGVFVPNRAETYGTLGTS